VCEKAKNFEREDRLAREDPSLRLEKTLRSTFNSRPVREQGKLVRGETWKRVSSAGEKQALRKRKPMRGSGGRRA
jgi:hypothetical protein